MSIENLVSDLEAKDWNHVCLDSIRKEKAEIAKRYNIRFGQTEFYCSRCEKPISEPLKHQCLDIRFEKLKEQVRVRHCQLKELEGEALKLVERLGAQKVAIYLMIRQSAVSKWIHRGSIPKRYLEKVDKLKKCV